MSTSTTYFVIYSNTSRNGTAGLRPQVMWTFDETIIEAAAWELNRSGESLEDMAGVEWVEDADGNMKPAPSSRSSIRNCRMAPALAGVSFIGEMSCK